MKVLVVSQYFWPENFRINDLVLGFCERGLEVDVLTGKPNYPNGVFHENYSFFGKRKEVWNDITIYRSPLIPRGKGGGLRLMINYLSFSFFATMKLLFHKKKYDLIFVYEPSPITVGIPAVIFSKKTKTPIYFWVQDLWPESVSVAGQIRNKSVLKALNRLTCWIYNNSKRILIQSEGFRNYILKQDIPDERIRYYPNSTESLFKKVVPSKKFKDLMPNAPFSIMFAGNIGEAQDFENILETSRILKEKNENIHFVILGDGRKKAFVESKIREYGLDDTFHLLGSYPVETMPEFFALADGLLVSLKKNPIFSLTIPSKVQSYLACGKPLIAALDGEGAKIIKDAKAGFVSPPGDSKRLAEVILKLYEMKKEDRSILGTNARAYFDQNFEREMLLDKLVNIFSEE